MIYKISAAPGTPEPRRPSKCLSRATAARGEAVGPFCARRFIVFVFLCVYLPGVPYFLWAGGRVLGFNNGKVDLARLVIVFGPVALALILALVAKIVEYVR